MSGDDDGFDAVRRLLDEGASGVFPGAVAGVLQDGHVRLLHAAGVLPPGPTRPDTIYDLASLTKPIAVMTLVADLLASGALRLDDPIGDVISSAVGRATIAEALGHATGLPAHRDFARLGSPDALRAAVLSEPPIAAPGERTIYSDLGYMTLGFYLETRFGAPLDALVDAVLSRLGLTGIGYHLHPRGDLPPSHYAPTDARSGHGPESVSAAGMPPMERRGEVHDANAAALGGVAGHAGLFGDALSVARWADRLSSEVASRTSLGLTLEALWSTTAARDASTWRLGLDTPSAVGSTAGHPPQGALGHLGFTGTSVWLVPERRWSVVLLSNRVYGRSDAESAASMRHFRPRFHDAVWDVLRCSDGSVAIRKPRG